MVRLLFYNLKSRIYPEKKETLRVNLFSQFAQAVQYFFIINEYNNLYI